MAIERALNVLQGTRFNRKKSQQLAHWIIAIVVSGISASYIYDPLYRRPIHDVEAQRFFCVAQYSASVLVFDRLVNILHFSFPFAINGLSALIIILKLAQRRSKLDERRSYREVFLGELKQHKNLVISPAILLLLTLPRLFMSILPECTESARNPWFYASNCYISFIPPMLTFVIFVQPSKNYRKKCFTSIQRFFSAAQRRDR